MISTIEIVAGVQGEQADAIRINTPSWEFKAEGQGHVILHNTDKQDSLYFSVLSICKHEVDSLPSEFQTTYQSILERTPLLSKYLLKRRQLTFSQEEKGKFEAMIEPFLSKSLKKCKVYISQNLSRSRKQWDYMLQFKPKTPIPDIYSREFLIQFGQQHKIDPQNLLERLKSSPSEEKIRWFKKNCTKEKKSNMNSLDIFSVHRQNIPNYQGLLKPFDNISSSAFRPDCGQIDKQIKKTNILQEILKVQMLHYEENDFSKLDFNAIWASNSNKIDEIQKITDSILKDLSSGQDMVAKLEKDFHRAPIGQAELANKNSFEAILRFLMSWSWRDNSLIIRLKMSEQGKQIKQTDIKIIDYELKQAAKLVATIEKDSKFLQKYLTFKNII